MGSKFDRRNQYFFGLGTIGRDMFYSMVSLFVMFYMTDVLNVSNATLAIMTGLLVVLRCLDACNDPIMGLVVDNTRSRFGKFKPWILVGAIVGAIFMVMMFVDWGLSGAAYAVVFGVCYLMWDVFYGLNDIAYWSMMPTLSTDQKQREKIGSFARICANIGMFAVVVGIQPLTGALGQTLNNDKLSWLLFAILIAALMIGFQLFTLLGVKEQKGVFKQEEHTSLKQMFGVLFHNDQLLWVAVSMSLFMIGYCTTTGFGIYFFKYAYKDAGMYSVFAAVLGVSQLAALSVFTWFRKRFTRRKLYTLATGLVLVGYVLFFFAPMNMLFIGLAGLLIFVGQAFIQMLMLMFLADTIEYGQWKLHKRNESITFSVQPFINKIGGAIATGVQGITLLLSGINDSVSPEAVTSQGILILKISMMILPLISIVVGYVVYMRKFTIDETRYAQILKDLQTRGDVGMGEGEAGTEAQPV